MSGQDGATWLAATSPSFCALRDSRARGTSPAPRSRFTAIPLAIRALSPAEAPAFFVELATLRARVVLAHVEGARRIRPRFVLTCVSAIEALLGLKTACALTPRRLYRSLVARGAKVIVEHD